MSIASPKAAVGARPNKTEARVFFPRRPFAISCSVIAANAGCYTLSLPRSNGLQTNAQAMSVGIARASAMQERSFGRSPSTGAVGQQRHSAAPLKWVSSSRECKEPSR